jgi:hypothetical protein
MTEAASPPIRHVCGLSCMGAALMMVRVAPGPVLR